MSIDISAHNSDLSEKNCQSCDKSLYGRDWILVEAGSFFPKDMKVCTDCAIFFNDEDLPPRNKFRMIVFIGCMLFVIIFGTTAGLSNFLS